MKISILGVFEPGFANYFFGLVVFIFFLVVLIEATVMLIMKYNTFKKSLVQALITNLVAVILALILTRFYPGRFSSYGQTSNLPLVLITFAGELATLYFLNQNKTFITTIAVCTVMNLVSYLVLFALSIG